MMVEALGALIILGALLILVVRYISRKPQAAVVTEEMQVSTEQLKAELARSGDEVIKRMGSHIEHLEGLLRQADDRTARLETRLAEYERLEGRLDSRITLLEQELASARTVTQELTTARTAVPTMPSYYPPQMPIAPAPTVPVAPVSQPIASDTDPSEPTMPLEPIADTTADYERVDANDFAAVLQQSIERESSADIATADNVAAVEPVPAEIPAEQAADLIEAMGGVDTEVAEPDEATPEDDTAQQTNRARALLRSGYSPEEIARDTGLGRGAIELLRQMNKKEIEG